jgi:hypothetical protein
VPVPLLGYHVGLKHVRFRDGGDAVAVAAGLLFACLAGRGGGVSFSGLTAKAAAIVAMGVVFLDSMWFIRRG